MSCVHLSRMLYPWQESNLSFICVLLHVLHQTGSNIFTLRSGSDIHSASLPGTQRSRDSRQLSLLFSPSAGEIIDSIIRRRVQNLSDNEPPAESAGIFL
jgi:hypothetical protein